MRQRSAALTPASCSFSTPIICSSVNLCFFISPSSMGRTLIQSGGNSQWQVRISPVDGLYYVGRPWQRNRASGLIAGVADDAAFIVEHIRQRCLRSL
ncbi:exported hypothetical protein [Agrobacterium genomosp. 2 str. CFBP 5494]|uniref:Uncharacterized protein n=1 Tax=Agrobacterium genomosp. 2 str. CFBP 5494 TaxID=1183436 RepID=A0A9W5F855_9HYPH|nr:exported hypothetical protein [Agrobacterium genomosp. 2 str. CFBP 5494]